MPNDYLYNPCVCPICGKTFNCYLPGEWVYKINNYSYHGSKNVCSYPCMRKWQREHKEDYD